MARPDQVAGMSGMQVFEAMFDGRLPSPPIGATLDFLPVHIEPGIAVFQGRPGFQHYNPLGTVHGGWFATLLDSAVGCAVHSSLPAGKAYTTLELKINIVRALTDKVPLVRAEGRVVHGGNQVATAEGRLDRAGRQAVCARHHHLPGVRRAALKPQLSARPSTAASGTTARSPGPPPARAAPGPAASPPPSPRTA